MRFRLVGLAILALLPAMVVNAQDSPTSPQGPPPEAGSRMATGQGRGRGWGAYMGGRGVVGVVTEVAPDHYAVKNDNGETYTIHYSANTHVVKQSAQRSAPGEAMGNASGGNQGQPISRWRRHHGSGRG